MSSSPMQDQGRQLVQMNAGNPIPLSFGLTPFQRDCVEFFIHAASTFALPKSIGEIYGLLFSTEEPLPMDEIVTRLRISKGSVSQGLRWLREVGAVQKSYVEGDRRDHFTAETRLRHLASGFLREQIQPRLESGSDRLLRMKSKAEKSQSTHQTAFEKERMQRLHSWMRSARLLFPLLEKLMRGL